MRSGYRKLEIFIIHLTKNTRQKIQQKGENPSYAKKMENYYQHKQPRPYINIS